MVRTDMVMCTMMGLVGDLSGGLRRARTEGQAGKTPVER